MLSPKKRRAAVDESVTTPKRQRVLYQSTPGSSSRTRSTPQEAAPVPTLPVQLIRIRELQQAIQNALAHGLATSGVAPDLDTGRVPNVINHVSLAASAGSMNLKFAPSATDICRLCWFWEWDAEAQPGDPAAVARPCTPPPKAGPSAGEDDNPFLSAPGTPTRGLLAAASVDESEWRRGGMGFLITATTHFVRTENRRVPAYGIGVEVDIQTAIDDGMGYGSGTVGAMASVTRWMTDGPRRMKQLQRKLDRWLELHPEADAPLPPLADLPSLGQTPAPKEENSKRAAISGVLLSPSPGGTIRSKLRPGLEHPGSPSNARSPARRLFPTGQRVASTPSRINARFPDDDDLGMPSIPFPTMRPFVTPSRNNAPQTPSTNRTMPPPDSSPTKASDTSSVPSTPQTGGRVTPTSSSRRQALYERVRQRSLSNNSTPTTNRVVSAPGTPAHVEEMDRLRRNCLLARLGDIAESVWMLFSSNGSTSVTASASGLAMGRRRRSMPADDVVRAVVKSSSVPLSESEAQDSLNMLCDLCPFFLKRESVNGEDWIEMPASTTSSSAAPLSPGATSAAVLLSRSPGSPRKVKNEAGGLREVRERIQRALRE